MLKKKSFKVRFCFNESLVKMVLDTENHLNNLVRPSTLKRKMEDLSQGDVCIYADDKVPGVFSVFEECIILENSIGSKEKVLICPIMKLEDAKNIGRSGLNIGYLYDYDFNRQYIAIIEEIRLVKKNRLIFDINENTFIRGSVSKDVLIDVFDIYNKMLKRMLSTSHYFKQIHDC